MKADQTSSSGMPTPVTTFGDCLKSRSDKRFSSCTAMSGAAPGRADGCRGQGTDKGYDSKVLRAWLRQRGLEPSSRHAKKSPACDAGKCRCRNVVERAFCRLKGFPRITIRNDKFTKIFLAALCRVAAILRSVCDQLLGRPGSADSGVPARHESGPG